MDRASIHAVILYDPNGDLLGWVLWHPNLGVPSGRCVFLPLPAGPGALGTPAAEALYDRQQAGESEWREVTTEPLAVAVATPGLSEELFVEFATSGACRWGFGNGDTRRVIGPAQPAKPSGE